MKNFTKSVALCNSRRNVDYIVQVCDPSTANYSKDLRLPLLLVGLSKKNVVLGRAVDDPSLLGHVGHPAIDP